MKWMKSYTPIFQRLTGLRVVELNSRTWRNTQRTLWVCPRKTHDHWQSWWCLLLLIFITSGKIWWFSSQGDKSRWRKIVEATTEMENWQTGDGGERGHCKSTLSLSLFKCLDGQDWWWIDGWMDLQIWKRREILVTSRHF